MKNELKKYTGVVVPMVSPFNEDYSIDEGAVERIISSFIENNVQPLILGTTGEVASMSDKQKTRLVKIATHVNNGKMPIAAGLCGNSLMPIVEEGKIYADLGVDALVCLAPNYYPLEDANMLKWFETLADKLPLPVFLYNIPATTHHSISLDVIEKLSHHPNIIGIKDSQPDKSRLDESLQRWSTREDFLFLVGSAANSSYGLKNGADGIVPSVGNLFPDLYYQLYNAAKQGDFEKAEKYQQITNEISAYNQSGRTVTGAIPALKALMSIKGLCSSHVMPPMLSMEAKEEENYLTEMRDKILNPSYLTGV